MNKMDHLRASRGNLLPEGWRCNDGGRLTVVSVAMIPPEVAHIKSSSVLADNRQWDLFKAKNRNSGSLNLVTVSEPVKRKTMEDRMAEGSCLTELISGMIFFDRYELFGLTLSLFVPD